MPPAIRVDVADVQRDLDRRRPGRALSPPRAGARPGRDPLRALRGRHARHAHRHAGAQRRRPPGGLRGAARRVPPRPRRLRLAAEVRRARPPRRRRASGRETVGASRPARWRASRSRTVGVTVVGRHRAGGRRRGAPGATGTRPSATRCAAPTPRRPPRDGRGVIEAARDRAGLGGRRGRGGRARRAGGLGRPDHGPARRPARRRACSRSRRPRGSRSATASPWPRAAARRPTTCSSGGRYLSNHAGGISGGISNGADVVVRVAVRPRQLHRPASRPRPPQAGGTAPLAITGRHDPCICPRVVPVAEAMLAVTLMDAWLRQRALRGRER